MQKFPLLLETLVKFAYILMIENDPLVRDRIMKRCSDIVKIEHCCRRHYTTLIHLSKGFIQMSLNERPITSSLLDRIDRSITSIQNMIRNVSTYSFNSSTLGNIQTVYDL